jgi:hypothetical protein
MRIAGGVTREIELYDGERCAGIVRLNESLAPLAIVWSGQVFLQSGDGYRSIESAWPDPEDPRDTAPLPLPTM